MDDKRSALLAAALWVIFELLPAGVYRAWLIRTLVLFWSWR